MTDNTQELDEILELLHNSWLEDDYNPKDIDAIEAKQALLDWHNKQVEEVTKAFGGCTRCYGKGYASFLDGTTAFADFGDEFGGRPYIKTTEYTIKFCDCQRGIQIHKVIEAERNKLKEES